MVILIPFKMSHCDISNIAFIFPCNFTHIHILSSHKEFKSFRIAGRSPQVSRSNQYHFSCIIFFKFFYCYYYYFFLHYNIVLVLPYINMNPPRVYTCSPSWTPFPPPSPYHPSGSSQCTSPKLPISCIKPRLVIHFLYNIIHVLMPFSQIIPPPPATESKRLFYTSVSLLLSCIQGCHYHLSKFHIYALVYCIGVFLSGLLHSV